jgi:hypothetical protein
MTTPAGAAATTVRLSLGTDATGTRIYDYPLPAGPQTQTVYPNLNITGTTILQLSTTGTTGIAVCTGSGSVDVA